MSRVTASSGAWGASCCVRATSRSSTTTSCWPCAASASRSPTAQIVALLGANGAGKTTLLRALTGLLDIHDGEITKGRVSLDDRPLNERRARADRRAGVRQVLEGRRVFVELTRRGEPQGRRPHGPRGDGRATSSASSTLFPVLADRRAQTAGYLSGGEQQMLAIGRALMSGPALPPARRAEPRPGPADGRADPRRDRRDQRGRHRRCCSSSRTPPWRSRSPTTATSWRPAGSSSTSRPRRCSRDDDVREFYLGLHPGEDGRKSFRDDQALPAQEAVVGMTADPVARRRRRPPLLRGRQGHQRRQLRGPPRRAVRDHRPQRRRQDVAVQRALRRLPPAAGLGGVPRREHPGPPPLRDRRARDGPHLPEHRALRAPHRHRQPDARPPPAHPLRRRRRRSPGAAGPARGDRAPRASSRRSSTSSSSSSGARCPSACCRTACRSGSSSAARSPWSPSCCCSTSRSPGMNLEETEDTARFILDIRDELRRPDHHGRARHGPGDGPRRPGAWWSTSASRSPPARPTRCSATPTSIRAYLGRGGRRRDEPRPPASATTRRARCPHAVALRDKDLGHLARVDLGGRTGSTSSWSATRCSPSASRPATGSRSTPRTGPSG